MQPSERQPHTKQEHVKPILESKAIQDIGTLTDAKSYRQWNKKRKNALEQTREQSRGMLEVVEKMTEEEIIQHKSSRASMLTSSEGFTYGESIIDLMMEKSGTAEEEKSDGKESPRRSIETCGRYSAQKQNQKPKKRWMDAIKVKDFGHT